MRRDWSLVRFLFVVLAAGLLALATGCEEDAPQLGSGHPGWQTPDCRSCHSRAHNADKVPGQCAECHGNNGAPEGHGETDGCDSCHADDIAWHGNADQFPIEYRNGCHG